MSMSFSEPTTLTPAQEAERLRWASALARFTTSRREQLGLTIQAAAVLAGLEVSQWISLEEGWVPQDLATLQAIADTLRVRWTDYSTLAFFAECHQKCC